MKEMIKLAHLMGSFAEKKEFITELSAVELDEQIKDWLKFDLAYKDPSEVSVAQLLVSSFDNNHLTGLMIDEINHRFFSLAEGSMPMRKKQNEIICKTLSHSNTLPFTLIQAFTIFYRQLFWLKRPTPSLKHQEASHEAIAKVITLEITNLKQYLNHDYDKSFTCFIAEYSHFIKSLGVPFEVKEIEKGFKQLVDKMGPMQIKKIVGRAEAREWIKPAEEFEESIITLKFYLQERFNSLPYDDKPFGR